RIHAAADRKRKPDVVPSDLSLKTGTACAFPARRDRTHRKSRRIHRRPSRPSAPGAGNLDSVPPRRPRPPSPKRKENMTTLLPTSTDVVIVGAGPTGLALAATLAQKRVPFLLLDRLPEGANTSRAAVVHARTLEVLEGLGVTDRLRAEGLV